ncbi:MAG: rpsP [Candidatus Saccharibacteria bacterium]|nr:rpsP [Candidatus Saccharibacteria bacterium]
MLAIRMQRTGRKGHAQFRLIVQESRRTPSSGNVVAALGSYDPHTKAVILDKEVAQKFLDNGAQPSPRMVMIMQKEGIKLPSWVKVDDKRTKSIKHTEKLRRNQTPEPVEEVAAEEVVADAPAEVVETPETAEAEAPLAETPVEETPAAEEAAPEEAVETEAEAETEEVTAEAESSTSSDSAAETTEPTEEKA